MDGSGMRGRSLVRLFYVHVRVCTALKAAHAYTQVKQGRDEGVHVQCR